MLIVSLLCDCWLKGRFDEADVKCFIFFSSSLILSLCITMQSSTALILLVILSRETLISCKILSKEFTVSSHPE